MGEVSRIEIGDGELEFECEYAPSQGNRQTLLLIHGYTGSRDDFREQLPPLARLGTAIALDQRGHGGSHNPGREDAYTFEALVSDLAAFVETRGLEEIDLLGHSMGGMVALRYALAHPRRIRSLILMDTAAGPVQMIPKPMRDAGAQLARDQGMSTLASLMRAGMERPGAVSPAQTACIERMGPDVFFDRIRRKLEQMDVVALETLGTLLGEHEAVHDRLPEIAAPTLVIVGREDKSFRAAADELAAGIANARLEVIPDAAHSPQLENPQAWLSAIADHLLHARGVQ